MRITVHFYSYFKDLTGCATTEENLAPDSTVDELLQILRKKFPRLIPMQNSTLVAIGVEYQPKDYVLYDGQEVSLFPPVQGG